MLIGTLIATTLLAATPPPADLSTLTEAQRKVFTEVAAEEFCSCNSSLTLAGCIELRPDCNVARHISRLVHLSAGANLEAGEILGYLSSRVTGPFCASQKKFDLTGAPTTTNNKSPQLTLVEFADFRCAHCKRAAPLVHESVRRFGKRVRWVFMPFPLQNHPTAVAAAEAALAAEAQGKFWPMHDALFEAQDKDFSPDVLEAAARKAGLNLERFNKEMAARKYKDKVMALKQQGLAAGVEGTPSFFVNGRPYELDPTLFTFIDRFEMELDRNRGKCQ